MKKILTLCLLLTFTACSGEQDIQIKELTKQPLDKIQKLTESLTAAQTALLGEAIGKCQFNVADKICDKTVKEVINHQ